VSAGTRAATTPVRRYAWRGSKERGQATAAAYVPLTSRRGKAFQFDWSPEVVLLNGVTVIVKVTHVRTLSQPHVVRAGLSVLLGSSTFSTNFAVRLLAGTASLRNKWRR
jgi:hypothetical protein